MHGDQKIRQFQVSLLMDNIAEAKELSDTLRELGIYAHFYDSLDDYWVAANADSPDLTIVDVKKMSSGKILFKNHPKIKTNALCYAFYYNDSTKVLLGSTHGLNHYGYIRKEVDMMGQIQSILRRRNEELHLIEQNIQLANRVDRLQKRSQRIVNDAQISYNFENQFQKMMDLVDRIGKVKTKEQFISNLTNVLSEWDECEQYGIYQLALNGQKLVSPSVIRPKFKSMPELWLSQASENGIDQYAIEMAEEVAFDSLNNLMRVIKIFGANDNPDMLVIGIFKENELSDFQWDLMQERVSNLYRDQLLQENQNKAFTNSEISIWDSFSYLDDIHFHQSKSKHKLFTIDFSNLLNSIKDKHANRFYWKSFFSDFSDELNRLLSGNFKLSQYGAQSLLVFIDKTYLDIDFQKIKSFVSSYEYWRYFEDSSFMMSHVESPEFKAVAPSSVNFLRQVYADVVNSGAKTNRRYQSVWENKQIEV